MDFEIVGFTDGEVDPGKGFGEEWLGKDLGSRVKNLEEWNDLSARTAREVNDHDPFERKEQVLSEETRLAVELKQRERMRKLGNVTLD